MAVIRAVCALGFWVLVGLCVCAPPTRTAFEEPTTSTQLSQDAGNSVWEEDDDVLDLDGDSWLKQPSAPLSPWQTPDQSPKHADFDEDEDEDNLIEDEGDEEDEEPDGDENPSEFLLVPAASVDKRDLKVRHTGRGPDGELDDSSFLERPDDLDPDQEENYDLVSFPEAEEAQPEENEAGDDLEEGDNDIFGEEDEDDSKRMFEDRVFLF